MAEKYPLQVVKDQRERDKKNAEEKLAESLRKLREAQEALETAKSVLNETRIRLEDLKKHLYDPDEFGLLDVNLVERRKEAVEFTAKRAIEQEHEVSLKEQAVHQAQTTVEEAQRDLVERMQALKAIEKHHENWIAEIRKEEQKKEQKMIEEIANAAFIRQSQEGGDNHE